MSSRTYDLIVFGATGVTGKQTVALLAKLGICQSWAIAGRRRERLNELQSEFSVPAVIVADTENNESLEQMAAQARLVLNATGPYRFFGEPVIKACIASRTDYIDLCGEPEFMERMLFEYNDVAREAGVIICQACAFDSVPADMGILRCAQLFVESGGECAHVEVFHSIDAPLGYTGHDTTFKAAVHGVGAARELQSLRRRIDERYGKIPKGSEALGKLAMKGAVSTEKRLDGKYVVPFIGADASVVRASRRMLANILQQQDSQQLMPQFSIYFSVACTSSILKVLVGGAIFQALAKWERGRSMLINNPGAFTFGGFSAEGPTEEQMKNNRWIGDYFASGLVAGEKKALHLQATLDDPGYIGTSLLFSVVAETILQDRNSLSASGGIFTPAALFCRSSLLDRLSRRGFEFKIVSSDLPVAG